LLSGGGDLVFIVEPDGTFRPRDLYKFLPYSTEFDVIFGTRTSKSCIWSGANMNWWLRIGNVIVAKLIEYLHNGPCLTDVGCTFKMLNRRGLGAITPYLTVGGSHFSPELMLVAIRTGLRCVEIPVHYRERLGDSKITGNRWRAIRLGLRLILMAFAYRFRNLPHLGTSIDRNRLEEMCSPNGRPAVSVEPEVRPSESGSALTSVAATTLPRFQAKLTKDSDCEPPRHPR
jgi:hypothetical protein